MINVLYWFERGSELEYNVDLFRVDNWGQYQVERGKKDSPFLGAKSLGTRK